MEFKVFEQLWFPTPVWECNVEGIDNTSIKEYCLEVKQNKKGVTISNRGGWHSSELIYPIPDELTKLFKDMEVFVNLKDILAIVIIVIIGIGIGLFSLIEIFSLIDIAKNKMIELGSAMN